MSAGPAKKLAAHWDWTSGAPVPDARIVVCAPESLSDDARARMWTEYARGTAFVGGVGSGLPYALELYPALHVRTQADLARLPDLLAVRAERRALVVSPDEAIDLYAPIDGMPSPRPLLDVVFIVGLDKPVHPDWVRPIVEQCRKAGVLVILVTWGEWVPTSQRDPRLSTEAAQPAVGCMKFIENEAFLCVGAERSGALLDGQPIEDVPAWLGGDHG